jgi:uncharacterized protein (DUF433 family)
MKRERLARIGTLVAAMCSASRTICPRRSRARTGIRTRQVAWFGFGSELSSLGREIGHMEGLDRITIEPGKIGGQPCIRGHRFTVEHLLSLVGAGWTLEQIQEDFPFIEAADIQQAVAYAAFSVREYHLPTARPA